LKVLTTATSALLLLIQAMGLQLVCLCGSCDLSHAWTSGFGAPPEDPHEVHACCQKAMDEAHPGAPRLFSHRDCCGDRHAVRAPETTSPEKAPAVDPPHLVAVTAALPAPAVVVPPVLDRLAGVAQSRGPPGHSGEPLYLTTLSLRI